MIRHYSGEYLISPFAVHLDLNRCSHDCFYCFANLNCAHRKADWKQAMRFVAERDNYGKNLAKWFLHKGYPILVSNTSDPFAKSNAAEFRAFHDFAASEGIRFAYQTKGGTGAADCILGDAPTCVYISITSDRDDVSRMAEPGAPLPGERIELAKACAAAGHFVVLGVNPFIEAWWNDFDAFCEDMAGAGIRHAWIGTLHISAIQEKAIPPQKAKKFSNVLATAKGKAGEAQRADCAYSLNAAGLNVFEYGVANTPGFWNPVSRLGFPSMPTLDGWIDRMHRFGGGKNVLFFFDQFARYADIGIPFEASAFKEYLFSIGRAIRSAGEAQEAKSFRDVCSFLWRIDEFPTIIAGEDRLSIPVDGKGRIAFDSENGRMLLAYTPNNTFNPFIDISTCIEFKEGR